MQNVKIMSGTVNGRDDDEYEAKMYMQRNHGKQS